MGLVVMGLVVMGLVVMGLVVTGLVVEDKQLAVEVRVLAGADAQPERLVSATIEGPDRESVTLTIPGDSDVLSVGTLVEIITPDRYYLGEVVSRRGNTGVVRTEHELERSAVTALQAAWGTGTGPTPGSGNASGK